MNLNKDIIAGNWKKLKGKIQSQWGKLTDDVFDVEEGNREYLIGKIQEKYGRSKAEAENEVSDWEKQNVN